MKLAVIYDSKTNNTAAVAGYMADGMNSIEGVEAKTFMYSEADTEFIKECTGVVFGCPTYMAGPTADFYTWMEKSAKTLNLAGKLGGVFATEQYIHGGADLTMNALLIHLLVYEMCIRDSPKAVKSDHCYKIRQPQLHSRCPHINRE